MYQNPVLDWKREGGDDCVSTTTSLTTGRTDTCCDHRFTHIWKVYKSDGQIYFKELNKKNQGYLAWPFRHRDPWKLRQRPKFEPFINFLYLPDEDCNN
jgi:hypothetical protein